jgi:hypothetical protein
VALLPEFLRHAAAASLRLWSVPLTAITPPPNAVVVTNRHGFIQSMNAAAGMLLGIAPTGKARPAQIGGLFVQGRVSLRQALRDVHVGGKPVERPASVRPNGLDVLPLTVSITGLDDGFRWVLRPVGGPTRLGAPAPAAPRAKRAPHRAIRAS